jgi:hypothetical protein
MSEEIVASEICWKRAKTSLPIPHLEAKPEKLKDYQFSNSPELY